MDSPPRTRAQLDGKWDQPHSGTYYASERFGNDRRRQRDLHLIEQLWNRLGLSTPAGWVLDVPAGTGRLGPLLLRLSTATVSIDVANAMLEAHPGPRRLRGSAFALPLADGSMDAVLCCRLFHHLGDWDTRRRLLEELLRVSRGPVLMSFWDAGSYHAWRRRVGLRKVTNQDGRQAVRRRDLETELQMLGAQALAYAYSLWGISQQAFVAFGRRP